MPFPMKIQPIDDDFPVIRDSAGAEFSKPVFKYRLKRLLDRPFSNVLRSSNSEKSLTEAQNRRDGEFEPSLAKMVLNYYLEEYNEKQTKIGRNHSYSDLFDGSFHDAYEHFKSLLPCASVAERNLLADATEILEKNNSVKRKDDLRKIVTDGLTSLCYDSSICKSKWDKTRTIPAGEYEYIDVIVNGERYLIDVDFRSEFEIARQTKAYKTLLQSLPLIFVGKSDRLRQIVSIVSDAAKQSLKKKGMHFPPWRKADYMRAKWLSSYTRYSGNNNADNLPLVTSAADVAVSELDCSEIELNFEDIFLSPMKSSSSPISDDVVGAVGTNERKRKVVTGLASLLKENP